MQTFLPYPSFRRSARVLDPRRLGKQRVEVLQILRALHVESYGWQHHPVVIMWRGRTEALVTYGAEVTREWIRRGHADTVLPQLLEFARGGRAKPVSELRRTRELPDWLGWKPLHRSHRSALLRKDPAYYRALFPDVPDDLPYAWPELDDAPPPAPGPLSAWVVRARGPREAQRFARDAFVALPALERGVTRAGTKAQRQVETFRTEPRAGDAVALLLGDRLRVGEFAGGYRHVPRSRTPHVRDVRWLGDLPRDALRLPGRLQDPRLFFALRGEEDPRRLLAARR